MFSLKNLEHHPSGLNNIFSFSVIEEANWLTLPEDIPELIGDGFDALICMGNSFAHLPDFGGEQQVQFKQEASSYGQQLV